MTRPGTHWGQYSVFVLGPTRPRTLSADSLASALTWSLRLGRPPLLDLDATLVTQNARLTPEPCLDLDRMLLSRVRDLGAVIVTNRRTAPPSLFGIPVVMSAHKPFTALSQLKSPGVIGCVIGDQYATDGFLAARLGTIFLRVPPKGSRPTRAALLDSLFRGCFEFMGDIDNVDS